MKSRVTFIVAGLALALIAVPRSADACAACMGDPNSDIAGAANAAVFSMLGLISGVLGLISAFGYSLYRRSLAPVPPHAELTADGAEPTEGGIS
jgi:hypothetical protein